MKDVFDFNSKEDFKAWLELNHENSKGVDIYIYKKNFHHKGLSYEDAVRSALCYGWIDAVTHSYNEEKFIQYFAKRKKNSNWSLSNILNYPPLSPLSAVIFNTSCLQKKNPLS